jgi:hypothetical protein
MDKDEIIKELAEKNAKLEAELLSTREHLKKYTASASSKIYYENNKETILLKHKSSEYKEKRKDYNRKSYLKKIQNRLKEKNDIIYEN